MTFGSPPLLARRVPTSSRTRQGTGAGAAKRATMRIDGRAGLERATPYGGSVRHASGNAITIMITITIAIAITIARTQ